ncbi:MAG: hypothetical protein MUE82_01600 [Chloroflexi bacterium]|nr:hypothetical protein [Chloroflexota bacterium]
MAEADPILDAGYAPAGDARAAYETHGVSLVRYLARRTAKTRLLAELPALLPAHGEPDVARALAVFGIYCIAAAASFGQGYRQPTFDPTGTSLEEVDPETSARLVARLERRGPGSRLRLAVDAEVPGIGRFEGREEIVGTTVGIRGLGMPAPSRFTLRTADPLAAWAASAVGVVTAELAPRLGGTLVRGHGSLDLSDDRGTRGRVVLERSGLAEARTDGPRSVVIRRSFRR